MSTNFGPTVETAKDLILHIVGSYRDIFSEEKIARGVEFVLFVLVFVFLLFPAIFWCFSLESAPWWCAPLVGLISALLGYQAAYTSSSMPSGLLKLSVADYLQTRLVALMFGLFAVALVPLSIAYVYMLYVWPVLMVSLLAYLVWHFLLK